MKRLKLESNEVIAVVLDTKRGEKEYYVKGTDSGRLVILDPKEYLEDQVTRVIQNYRLNNDNQS